MGLLGRSELAEGEGLWIQPCNSIHTWFMRFPIDAIFFDKTGKVAWAARVQTTLEEALPH